MNRFLLDTNILVFLVRGDMDEISPEVRLIIEDFNNRLETSSVSLVELVQLYRIGKIKLMKGQRIEHILDILKNSIGVYTSSFTEKHVHALSNLEVTDDHRDPFDHAILSHAIADR